VPDDVVPIGSLHHRDRVTVAGRVRQVRVQPRAGVATVQVTLTDGTGDIQVVFLGRRHVAGIVPGTCLSAHGVVGEHGGHQEMLNPDYTLLVAP
jgi:RecG-like helicase